MLCGRSVQVLSACICIVSTPVRACDVNLASESIRSISDQLLERKVARIDVLRVADNLSTFKRISPEDFEGYEPKQYALHLTEQDAAELAAAVKKLKLTELTDRPDLRWKVVFRDGSGNRLHSIFLDRLYWYGRGRKSREGRPGALAEGAIRHATEGKGADCAFATNPPYGLRGKL